MFNSRTSRQAGFSSQLNLLSDYSEESPTKIAATPALPLHWISWVPPNLGSILLNDDESSMQDPGFAAFLDTFSNSVGGFVYKN